MKRIQPLVLLFLLLVSGMAARAQGRVALKTNLLYDATATVNLGVEVGLARRLSLDVSGNLNLWDWQDNMKWKHWMVQPELRYWTCQRFAGHFFGIHALAGQFNFGNIHMLGRPIPDSFRFLGTDYSLLSKYRYEGWAFGGGVAYGYALPVGKHWNLEFELGVGAIYSIADSFDCDICNRPAGSNITHLRPAVTKAVVGIVYLF